MLGDYIVVQALVMVTLVIGCGQAGIRHKDNRARDVHLKVTTILVEPYAMPFPGSSNTSNGRYHGYMIDLMDHITRMLGLQYRIHPVRDGNYGYLQTDGTWDGMVGEVAYREADIAAAPLYVTRHRLEVVDFTKPVMRVHATLLQKRSSNQHHVASVYDLLHQSDVRYGSIQSGMLVRSFKTTNDSYFRALWSRMRDFSPSVFHETNEAGIEQVRASDGQYAFILPDIIGDYIIRQQPCDLTVTDKFLMHRAFGLAVQKGSGLLPQVNRALDMLEKTGILEQLYEKWWLKRSACNGVHSSKIYSLNSVEVSLGSPVFSRLQSVSISIYGVLYVWCLQLL